MNNWNFTGHVGKADMRYLASGDPILNFSVAVTSGYGDKQATTWANCSLFGKRAESLEKYVKKGQLVGVSGEVTLREWTDREGGKRQNLEVRVDHLTLLGKKPDEPEAAPSTYTPPSDYKAEMAAGGSGFDDFENDVPF